MMQNTSHILMIRPVNFEYNSQTAINNSFQTKTEDEAVSTKAIKEFDAFVELLKNNNIDVMVVDDTATPITPDSIFPNNWISFHEGGTICLYPMFAENRRAERKPNVIKCIENKFKVLNTIDFTDYELDNVFLEGTGSMVLDREKKIAYACLSPRTDWRLFKIFCQKLQYKPISFIAVDAHQQPIYHTNVMMCVADKYAIICLDAIQDQFEKDKVIATLNKSGKEIIEINLEQINFFAGNMLQVKNKKGNKLLVMSSQSYKSLTQQQLQRLKTFNKIIHSNLSTIEKNGGGSARCMMAEIFLPPL